MAGNSFLQKHGRTAGNYDKERAREQLRACLPDYLRDKGLNLNRPFRCLNPEHADHNPSMSYDKNRQRVHCFSCGAAYDIVDLIERDYGLNTADAFRKGYELYGIDCGADVSSLSARQTSGTAVAGADGFMAKESTAPAANAASGEQQQGKNAAYVAECAARIGKTDYPIAVRGLTLETVMRYRLGYDAAYRTVNELECGKKEAAIWQALIIPTGPDSFTARNTDPNATGKNRLRHKGKQETFFNAEALLKDTPVFVVEGEIDALSILDVGGAAVGLGGTGGKNALIRYLRNNNIKRDYPLLLALDNDERGKEASREIAVALGELGIPFKTVDIFGECKDANEALISNREAFTAAVMGTAADASTAQEQAIEKLSPLAQFELFENEISRRQAEPPISTGYSELDTFLNGGLVPALYIVGAVSSLGKTAFCLQIADQIAMQGYPALVFSLEMSRFELMARSISRETYQSCGGDTEQIKSIALTTASILDGNIYSPRGKCRLMYTPEQEQVLSMAKDTYKSYAGNLYITEGVSNFGLATVRSEVDRFIRYKGGRRPVVFLDYLQLLSPDDAEERTDKQRMDLAVVELKRISRDYNVPVVVISSFNRQNYNVSARTESFKESGAIEYSADVLIGLQFKGVGIDGFNIDTARAANPREIEAVILKNRNGRAGDKIEFAFSAAHNCFELLADWQSIHGTDDSNTFTPTPARTRAGKGKKGKGERSYNLQTALDTFSIAVEEHGELNADGTLRGVHFSYWGEYLLPKLTAARKHSVFSKIRTALVEAGELAVDNDYYRYCDKHGENVAAEMMNNEIAKRIAAQIANNAAAETTVPITIITGTEEQSANDSTEADSDTAPAAESTD